MLLIFSAFAEFERNRIRERTKEGLERAKAQGKKLGRP
ncbi:MULTISPECIES: recombinase family protein [unclassified Shewanella]